MTGDTFEVGRIEINLFVYKIYLSGIGCLLVHGCFVSFIFPYFTPSILTCKWKLEIKRPQGPEDVESILKPSFGLYTWCMLEQEYRITGAYIILYPSIEMLEMTWAPTARCCFVLLTSRPAISQERRFTCVWWRFSGENGCYDGFPTQLAMNVWLPQWVPVANWHASCHAISNWVVISMAFPISDPSEPITKIFAKVCEGGPRTPTWKIISHLVF